MRMVLLFVFYFVCTVHAAFSKKKKSPLVFLGDILSDISLGDLRRPTIIASSVGQKIIDTSRPRKTRGRETSIMLAILSA